MDLIEVCKSLAQEGKYVLSVICAYSKAPELVCLKTRSAEAVTQAFKDQVVCRYGCPLVVRFDEGKEFLGKFKLYLRTIRCR